MLILQGTAQDFMSASYCDDTFSVIKSKFQSKQWRLQSREFDFVLVAFIQCQLHVTGTDQCGQIPVLARKLKKPVQEQFECLVIKIQILLWNSKNFRDNLGFGYILVLTSYIITLLPYKVYTAGLGIYCLIGQIIIYVSVLNKIYNYIFVYKLKYNKFVVLPIQSELSI